MALLISMMGKFVKYSCNKHVTKSTQSLMFLLFTYIFRVTTLETAVQSRLSLPVVNVTAVELAPLPQRVNRQALVLLYLTGFGLSCSYEIPLDGALYSWKLNLILMDCVHRCTLFLLFCYNVIVNLFARHWYLELLEDANSRASNKARADHGRRAQMAEQRTVLVECG